MMQRSPSDDLVQHSQLAFNYASDSENRMHSDEGAQPFGFRGGLVPGIADYAFFVPPVVAALGDDWPQRGWMAVRLLAPVYDGDRVVVSGRAKQGSPPSLELELRGADGTVCAECSAGIDGGPEIFEADLAAGPPPPQPEDRPPASLDELPEGTPLGSLEVTLDPTALRAAWSENFGPAGDWPGSVDAPHPAFYPEQGNRILTSNVVLGPWIHTESRTRHVDGVRWGERLSVRAAVREAFEKNGHERVHLDVGFYGSDGRTVALLDHRAIIRPRLAATA
ncbi:MAG: hypothetical protein VYE73_04850 [Acidobacteriota bacterium]|nr:hypothetical protein [Acidobacteriota bacterium]